jgi:hypothetical protein
MSARHTPELGSVIVMKKAEQPERRSEYVTDKNSERPNEKPCDGHS